MLINSTSNYCMMSKETGKKRKRTALTIEGKMNITELIEKGNSYANVTE